MKATITATLAIMSIFTAAQAADLNCTIHPPKGTATADLPAMAKITKEDAQKTALDAVKKESSTVVRSTLEHEKGCLVYSFDIKVANQSGSEEVMVDAGSGEVLSNKHQGVIKDTMEKVEDKIKKKQ